MFATVRRAAQTAAVWFIDVDGFICLLSDPARVDGRSRAFREYFSAARDAGPARHVVNRAVVGIAAGRPAFHVSRRVGAGPDFRGVVVTAVDLRDMRRYRTEILAEKPSQHIAIFRADGAAVARSWEPLVPPAKPEVERRLAVPAGLGRGGHERHRAGGGADAAGAISGSFPLLRKPIDARAR